MNRSDTIEKLAEALAQAQGEIEGAAKDKENPHFKSRYADLASIWDACRKPLSSRGLAVIQTTGPGESGGITLETTLVHTSGQWVSGVIPVQCNLTNPQQIGSALTYARRYGLAAIVGVCPDDDDAEAATQPYRDQRPESKNNGYSRPRQEQNGHVPPASRPEPDYAPPQRREQPRPNGHANGDGQGTNGAPRDGKALYRWTMDQEQRYQVGLLKYLNSWAKMQDFPGRMIEWDHEQVSLAHAEAIRKLQSKGHAGESADIETTEAGSRG